MAKIGLSLKIDVSKIDKTKMFKGEKGTYLDAVVFVDINNKDQWGNSGMIKQDWKDCDKNSTPILGNCKVFWSDSAKSHSQAQRPQQQSTPQEPDFEFDDSIPF